MGADTIGIPDAENAVACNTCRAILFATQCIKFDRHDVCELHQPWNEADQNENSLHDDTTRQVHYYTF